MITGDPVPAVLLKLAAPMMFGILGMSIFNLMDTYFIGKLGTAELAALSFTFPVVMAVGSIAHGLGVGMTAAVSKAVGSGDRKKLERIISDGLILSLIIAAVTACAGILSIRPLFTALGADQETLGFITKYMRIWYIGSVCVVIPMVGNSAIRGMGDTKIPSMVMLIAAVINTVLDPILIFGAGPLPALGVAGAAGATVFARFTTLIVALTVLGRREKVLNPKGFAKGATAAVIKEILYVGIPNALTKMILPVGTAVITGFVAAYGREAVAGYGVAGRIEMFALMPLMALTSIIPVFLGQNAGAGNRARMLEALKTAAFFSLAYGAAVYLIFIIGGSRLGSLFNDDPRVISVTALYLIIVPAAYCFRNMMDIGSTSLSVTGKPFQSALISIIQMFGLYIPLAAAGSGLFELSGIFGALALSLLLTGPAAFFITRSYISRMPISA